MFSPTIISTRKKAKVRLNMLTSLHFFPEYLPSPLPSPAPILIWSKSLCDNQYNYSSTIPQEVSKVLLTVFSCSLLLCINTGQDSMQSTWPVTRNIHHARG